MSNTARLGFALKPFAQRDSSADEVIARLRPKLAAIPGLSVRMVSSQDITVGARAVWGPDGFESGVSSSLRIEFSTRGGSSGR